MKAVIVKQAIGYCVLALPFIVISVFIVDVTGWIPLLVVWVEVIGILACLAVGFWLIQ